MKRLLTILLVSTLLTAALVQTSPEGKAGPPYEVAKTEKAVVYDDLATAVYEAPDADAVMVNYPVVTDVGTKSVYAIRTVPFSLAQLNKERWLSQERSLINEYVYKRTSRKQTHNPGLPLPDLPGKYIC